jgi:hypothetical protein
MIFDNVKLLGYKHENKFFGEKSISYGCIKTFSIKGYILDLANSNGVNNVLKTAVDLTKESKNFLTIKINNEYYGLGKIKSLSIDPGNWVRTTEYSADIEVLKDVPLQNMDSDEFTYLDYTDDINGVQTPINFEGNSFKLLKSLSENFSIDFNDQNQVLGGEHSIDIEYDSSNDAIDVINLARNLAKKLLDKTIPLNLAEGNYITRKNYRVFNTENYNVIGGKCGFKRRFSFNTSGDPTKPYSFNRKQSIDLSQDGLVTVKETCEIKAESETSNFVEDSLYKNALAGLNDISEGIQGASQRCTNLFNNYKIKFGISRDLNASPINKSIKINKFNGTISYDISYDNDIKKENPDFIWEKTLTMERSEEGIWSASEEGSIMGIGKVGDIKKYTNAENAWDNTIKSTIYNPRLLDFYNTYATNKNGSDLKQLSISVNRSPYNGTINYTYRYSDDPRIILNGNMITGPISKQQVDIRKVEIQMSDSGLQQLFKNFIIPNSPNKYIIVQRLSTRDGPFTNQGTFTISAKLSVGCLQSKKRFIGLDCFNTAQQQVRDTITNSTNNGDFNLLPYLNNNYPKDRYIESISFSSDEIEKTVTYEEVHKYS